MNLYILSISLAIIANIMYHIIQKSTPSKVNPVLSLIVTYFIAFIFSILIYFFYPAKANLFTALKELNWASYALGFAIVGLELGFLLAYRAGWNMSIGVITCNVIVTIFLIPIGIIFFAEKISLLSVIGIFLCLVGLYLISYK